MEKTTQMQAENSTCEKKERFVVTTNHAIPVWQFGGVYADMVGEYYLRYANGRTIQISESDYKELRAYMLDRNAEQGE